jgi:ATP-binding cassette subfamily F protein 3
MLFSSDDAFKKYGVLSGGERARVRLARLLLSPCNVLVMDEPTHHLDMASKDLLQQALVDYPGTVLLVSHDRDFVDGVATRVLEVRAGRVTEYPGDFAFYLSQRQVRNSEDDAAAAAAATRSGAGKNSAQPASKGSETDGLDRDARKEAEKRKRKGEKRMAEIEAALEKDSARLAEIEAALCRDEVFSVPDKLRAFEEEKLAQQERGQMLTDEWDGLSEAEAVAA